MDKISNLAFILYNETNKEKVREAAVLLLLGDLTIKQLKAMKQTKMHIKAASRKIKKGKINSKELYKFLEENIYSCN